MQKFTSNYLLFLGFIGVMWGLWGCGAMFGATTSGSTPTPNLLDDPSYLANDINLQPLLEADFNLTKETFEARIKREVLETSPYVTFNPNYDYDPKNALAYHYRFTNPAGLETGLAIWISFVSPSTPPLDCNYNSNPYRIGHSENNDNPYSFCIGYLVHPQGVFTQSETYSSSTEIRKGGLNISISEYGYIKEREIINEAIKQLAEVLHSPSP